MITENLSTLKIHKLTQEQYDRELAAGRLDENAIYLTPDEVTDMSKYATIEQLNGKADSIHKHNISDITNFPSSLPANGGNADTVDGKHASEFAMTSDITDVRELISTNAKSIDTLEDLVGDTSVSEQISTAIRENVSDWNAAEGEPGHVLNRTHWKEISYFDGDLTGKEYVDSGDGTYFIKITDILPSVSDFIGQTMIVHDVESNTDIECVLTEDDIYAYINEDTGVLEVISVMYGENYPIQAVLIDTPLEDGIIIPAGVYFYYDPQLVYSSVNIYAKSITGFDYWKYHQIDEKYLPKIDWDATKDEPGHINNRTHWRELVPADTFDGDLTGREYIDYGEGIYSIKISDVVPTVSDFIGQTMVIHNIASNIDKEYILTANDITVQEADDVLPEIIVIKNSDFEDPIQVVTKDFSDESGFTSAGVYFVKDSAYYTKSITGIKKYEYHPIDDKYLPEGVAEAATFIIHISKDEAENYSTDKTYDEIKEAYENGLTLKCELEYGKSFSLVGFNKNISYIMFAGFVVEDGLYMANGRIKELASITIDYSSKVTYRKMGIQNPSTITFRNAKYYTNKITPSNTSIGTVEYSGDSSKFISGLPNPYPVIINGTSYDGSAEAEITGLATEEYVDNAITGLSNLVGDTAVSEQINEAISQAQPDWNASEGEPGHILNRTHYKKKFTMLENAVCAYIGDLYYLPECGDIVVGDTYEITINGTSYTCKAFDYDGAPCIGSAEYLDTYDSSLPIPLAFMQDTPGSQIYGLYGDFSLESITVSLKRVEYEKIPIEYIPYFGVTIHIDDISDSSNATSGVTVPIELVHAYMNGYPIFIECDNHRYTVLEANVLNRTLDELKSMVARGASLNNIYFHLFFSDMCNSKERIYVQVRTNA